MKAILRETIPCNTVIIGSGAAGYNAADSLWSFGQKDIIIVTENRLWGTSRNSGSDKQTYYKLSFSTLEGDSSRQLAQTFFEGGAMDGDLALCEAALSAPSFFKLIGLGVPFPKNRYGEYIGYKTDHDPYSRGTSVGPYTSKIMTEKLEASVLNKGIPIHDRRLATKLVVVEQKVFGILCLDLDRLSENSIEFIYYNAKNVIFATGGPAGIYHNSVYPVNHFGGSGLAFAEGVAGRNVTEWQYGLASVSPRWNVSGSYMQVLPRFISTNCEGTDEREFLYDYIPDENRLLHKVFMKGYQWPFDVRKIKDGSSLIDVLVFLEHKKGRKVFLDFQSNPRKQKALDFALLPQESKEYLQAAEICFGTPYERLLKLNKPAIDLYADKGIDLSKEPLEIAFCAQHNNGGLAVNLWWETNITGVFAAGEASGTHGIYRPGGSALNESQVGSLRAAEYIASTRQGKPTASKEAEVIISEELNLVSCVEVQKTATLPNLFTMYTSTMSDIASAFRESSSMNRHLSAVSNQLKLFPQGISLNKTSDLELLYRFRTILHTQLIYLSAFIDYAEHVGISRGGALYYNSQGTLMYDYFPKELQFLLSDEKNTNIQEVVQSSLDCRIIWREPRPIPNESNFFETVWASFRENGNIY
jgi:succinate dehydrogenase/fumarate reductase flavoprotein subunit